MVSTADAMVGGGNSYRRVITGDNGVGHLACIYCFYPDNEENLDSKKVESENGHRVDVSYHRFCKKVIPMTPQEAFLNLPTIRKERYYNV